MYYPKDFILTPEGLAFAVVAAGLEEDKILGCLRYQQTPTGWKKLDTVSANTLLANQYPYFLYYSTLRDTACHAIPLAKISQHVQPQQNLQALLGGYPSDAVVQACIELVKLLQANGVNSHSLGITGSLLIGAQHPNSDIDLVFYDRATFQRCRQLLPNLISQGLLQPLQATDWAQAYQRRNCELSFDDYIWHEQRKANKAIIKGHKVDFSFVSRELTTPSPRFQKAGLVTRTLQVVDDSLAYDYPAEFKVSATDIERVVTFTATYSGQALSGEWIKVAGQLEVAENGLARIVVGANREAKGEYISVIRTHD